MEPKQLVVALSLASFVWGSATNAFARQAPAPAHLRRPPRRSSTRRGIRRDIRPSTRSACSRSDQYPPPPPPNSAVAPNGEFVAPMSQTTQPTYVPQSVAMSGPRFIKDWEEGQPIPYGYHHETRVRKGMVVSGSIVLGVLYLYSAFAAVDRPGRLHRDRRRQQGRLAYLPVLGPFLEMTETDSASLRYILMLDGLAQAAGAALLLRGVTYPKHLLVA